jgi:hypothetical protein
LAGPHLSTELVHPVFNKPIFYLYALLFPVLGQLSCQLSCGAELNS